MSVWYTLKELLHETLAGYRRASDSQKRIAATAACVGALLLVYLMGRLLLSSVFSSSPILYAVRGTVRFAGEPIQIGSVIFEPEEGKGGQRRMAQVQKGDFTLRKPEGLQRNITYVMRVSGFRNTGKKYENADMKESKDIYEQILPSQYNSASTLTITATRESLGSPLTLDLK